MGRWIAIFLAGGLGSITRFGVGQLCSVAGFTRLPYGTLSVNILGSFLIGFLGALHFSNKWISSEQHTVLTVGFLGGFTTFSALSWEMLHLIESGRALTGFLYGASSLFLGLMGAFAGAWLAKQI